MVFPSIPASLNVDHISDESFAKIEESARLGIRVNIKPKNGKFSAGEISQLDGLCARYGDLICVDFSEFLLNRDNPGALCSFVEKIPSVRNLNIQHFRDGFDLSVIRELRHLRVLRIGSIHGLTIGKEFLTFPSLDKLEQLHIGDIYKSRFDVESVGRMKFLRSLTLGGMSSGLGAIGNLPLLNELRLRSLPQNTSLDFLASLPALRLFAVTLGYHHLFSEATNHGLEHLVIARIRGLDNINLLKGFPSLKSLDISTQGGLLGLDLSYCLLIQKLSIANCPKLRELRGLRNLSNLFELSIYRTDLDYSQIEASGLPESLRVFHFLSGKQKVDKAISLRICERGYLPLRWSPYPRQ
jgi:hypothetical protein